MGKSNWRERAGTPFTCEKQPAHGTRGMVVTNHPLASAAGMEMLAAGGNAIDAAVAAQFALTVVEPMMVGLIGGTTMHVRLAGGHHTIIDGMSAVPAAGHPRMYQPIPGAPPEVYDVEGRDNLVGPKSVATPGSLRAWCLALGRYGTMSLADVMQPAIRHASRGFVVTPYLSDCIAGASPDLLQDPFIADRLLPDGDPLKPGERLVQGDYAEALTLISQHGEKALHGGPLGDLVVECMERSGGFVGRKDLTDYRVVERKPIRGQYRGWEIVGPPPPAASGVHITQMLNILEDYDIAGLGFGTVDGIHLLAEVLKIAFADRAQASGDPDFVKVPVERITSKAYARERRAGIDLARARRWTGALRELEGADTTHLTVADGLGNVVSDHPDHQQPVRRVLHRSRHRHGAEQLHVELRSAAGQCTVDRPGQARHHLDVADDGAARRPGRLCAGPARRPQDLPRRLPGPGQPDRPRHGAAGGGRGAAGLDRRARARGRARHSGKRSRRACKPAVTRCR